MNNVRNSCPICSSFDTPPLWSVKSNIDGEVAAYNLLNCRKCNVGLTNPIPSSSELSQYYNNGIYQKSGGRGNRLIDIALSLFHDKRLHDIEHICSSKRKLLDVGCGKSRFVARAIDRGWDAQGTDTNSGQIDAARVRYNIPISLGEIGEIGFDDAFFDVIRDFPENKLPRQRINEDIPFRQ
ncbi:MAG: hypothetical protein BBJ57_13335 [Desulfobacterales bacterium PC51MH44]|nr:MAG: hypothetical protein BBJ57_13335 [Desulfobacterales bacterium PC51MH44]